MYTSLSSRKQRFFYKKRHEKNYIIMGNAIETFTNTALGGIAGAATGAIGESLSYGLGQLTGVNRAKANDQIRQQQRLTDIQQKSNSQLMDESYEHQLELWNKTQAEAQVKHLKEAGLNPALIYAKGGAGGSTSGGGGTSVSAGTASGESERTQASTQQMGMGLQMQKLASEINLNNALAEANKANAEKAGAETKTTEATRTGIVEQINTTIENLKANTELKSEETKLNRLQQNATEIANEFNATNNSIQLQHNMQLLREITANANVAEDTQTSLVELAKNNAKLALSHILLNNSQISINEAQKTKISAEIDQICNSINISNKQIQINQQQLDQALDIVKMQMSSGVAGKEVRGLLLMIRNAITGRNEYNW